MGASEYERKEQAAHIALVDLSVGTVAWLYGRQKFGKMEHYHYHLGCFFDSFIDLLFVTKKSCGHQCGYPIDDYMPIRGEWHCKPGWLVEGTKIAGYEVAEIVMCFARDDIESELLSVLIVLDATDTEEAYGDLTSKLSQLYGEYDEGNFEESFVEMSDWKGSFNVWQGANNTAVMLAKRYGSRISLIYGTLDAQDILDAYYAEYQANTHTPAPVDSTDTSGL